MIREAIAKGETVEIAFATACRELGVETTEAEFEILELPQKKTFGLFGGAPARVRAPPCPSARLDAGLRSGILRRA